MPPERQRRFASRALSRNAGDHTGFHPLVGQKLSRCSRAADEAQTTVLRRVAGASRVTQYDGREIGQGLNGGPVVDDLVPDGHQPVPRLWLGLCGRRKGVLGGKHGELHIAERDPVADPANEMLSLIDRRHRRTSLCRLRRWRFRAGRTPGSAGRAAVVVCACRQDQNRDDNAESRPPPHLPIMTGIAG